MDSSADHCFPVTEFREHLGPSGSSTDGLFADVGKFESLLAGWVRSPCYDLHFAAVGESKGAEEVHLIDDQRRGRSGGNEDDLDVSPVAMPRTWSEDNLSLFALGPEPQFGPGNHDHITSAPARAELCRPLPDFDMPWRARSDEWCRFLVGDEGVRRRPGLVELTVHPACTGVSSRVVDGRFISRFTRGIDIFSSRDTFATRRSAGFA